MIRISKPRIEEKDNTTFLLSEVYDEVRNIRKDVWFSVDTAYAKYLCHELAAQPTNPVECVQSLTQNCC